MLDRDLAELYQVETRILDQGKHLKYMPYVFTEMEVAMLSSVLRSKIAVQKKLADKPRNPVGFVKPK